MGPHPAVAEVRLAVRRTLAGLCAARPEGGPGHACVLVACSGGADSLALAAALAFEAPRAGVPAGLVTIDHGLQDSSAEQAVRVAAIGYELGLDPVHAVRVEVAGSGGPEAAARRARYAALDAVAVPLDARVLLGHTLDDQAETVLLGLGRGSGPNSIAGMRPADGRYLRALLGVRRETTRAACAALGLEPWDDPHNDDPRFRRVRLRREVLPLLEDVLDGGVAAALARTATLLRQDLDALDSIARDRLAVIKSRSAGAGSGAAGVDHADIPVELLEVEPPAIRSRVLKLWAESAGAGPLNAEHVAALDELITNWHGQDRIPLPGGFGVLRASGTLTLLASAARSTPPRAEAVHERGLKE